MPPDSRAIYLANTRASPSVFIDARSFDSSICELETPVVSPTSEVLSSGTSKLDSTMFVSPTMMPTISACASDEEGISTDRGPDLPSTKVGLSIDLDTQFPLQVIINDGTRIALRCLTDSELPL